MNADDYSELRRWDAHTDAIWSLSFNADGKWLLSASDDRTVGVWDVATGSLIARLKGTGAKVLCAAISPDGTRIATGGRDGIVSLWDTTHFENVAQLRGHTDYIFSLAWSPDGRQLFSTSGDSTVRIWDTRTLAQQVAETRACAQASPRLEAQFAKARANTGDVNAAFQAVADSPELGPRDRELLRQIAARHAFQGQAPSLASPHQGKGDGDLFRASK